MYHLALEIHFKRQRKQKMKNKTDQFALIAYFKK